MSLFWKRLTAISFSCLLAWTGWPWSGMAAASAEQPEPGTPKVEWSSDYGQAFRTAKGKAVVSAADGGYVAIGDVSTVSNFYGYVIKVDEHGRTLWEKTLDVDGEPDIEDVSVSEIIPVRDGGYLVGGSTMDRTERPATTLPYLAKLDDQGNVEWSRYYHLLDYTHFYAGSVSETADGGFVVTGYSANSGFLAPVYLLKVDREGNEVWHKTWWIGDNQSFSKVLSTSDGGVLAVGRIDSTATSDSDASLVVKVDANGEVEWEKQQVFPGSGRSAWSAQMTPDGSFIISGMMYQDGKRITFVFKMDGNGEILWEKTYSFAEGEQFFNQLVSTPDGYALLGSYTTGDYPDQQTQYQILRIDNDGEVTGHLRFASPGLDSVGKGMYTADGGFLVTGEIREKNSLPLMQLIKVKGQGQQPPANLQELRFDQPALELGVGERRPSVVQAVYADGTAAVITNQAVLTSLNPEIAAVDSDGFITGLSPGTTEIVAEYEGFSAKLPVTVAVTDNPSETPGRFYLDSEDYSLMAGGELDTLAFFTDESDQTLIVNEETRFTIADPEIAQVDERGYLLGLKPGLTSVTAVFREHTFTASVLVVKPYVPVPQVPGPPEPVDEQPSAPEAPEVPEVNEVNEVNEGPEVPPVVESPVDPA